MLEITLREITKYNYEKVGELYLPDEQQEHLSRNIWSIAESRFHETYHARAIYSVEEPVGFIMWVDMSKDMTSIWRFMVAYEFQGAGVGRKALQIAIDEIKTRKDIERISICYGPENTVAKKLYFSSGFSEFELSDCGSEAYAQIILNADNG